MKDRSKRFSFRAQNGQTMAEFALVLPLLALLLFGVIQFGIAFNNYITLTDAVRAGARKGAVGRHLPDPEQAVIDQVEDAATDLNKTDLAVDVTSTWKSGEEVRVHASYPYRISLLGVVVKSGRMNSETTERVE
ncbi:MAG TPA: TadE family protein [Gaiellaceae bacterium]|nr:TadE family protein [Gaiellaceae bacterium]